MTKYRTHGQSQFLLSTEIILRPDNPNRNKPRSNPVTRPLMQPDRVTEGNYRVITHPRPIAEVHGVVIDVTQISTIETVSHQPKWSQCAPCLQGFGWLSTVRLPRSEKSRKCLFPASAFSYSSLLKIFSSRITSVFTRASRNTLRASGLCRTSSLR